MNYLKISNKGLIQIEDITLIGSSTKRGNTGMIGEYGSGWKYGAAWLLRNDCKPIIYSGNNEIKLDFDMVLHRDNPVKVITVNGQKTSITDQMGPKWQGWMALRELISNAIDAGEHNIQVVTEHQIEKEKERTCIYIPLNAELQSMMDNYDHYFSFKRTPLFETSEVQVFEKPAKSPWNIYRKGIRCYDTSRQMKLDYNFNTIEINESRLIAGERTIDIAITHMIEKGIPKFLFIKLLEESYIDVFPREMTEQIEKYLIEMIDAGTNFTCDAKKNLGGMIIAKDSEITIPNRWFSKLIALGHITSPVEEMFNSARSAYVKANKKADALKYYLNNVDIDIQFAVFKGDKEIVERHDDKFIVAASLDDRIAAAKCYALLKEEEFIEFSIV